MREIIRRRAVKLGLKQVKVRFCDEEPGSLKQVFELFTGRLSDLVFIGLLDLDADRDRLDELYATIDAQLRRFRERQQAKNLSMP